MQYIHFMTPDKYDHILIQRNPLREYSKPLKKEPYIYPKCKQLEIHYRCNSDYFKSQKDTKKSVTWNCHKQKYTVY